MADSLTTEQRKLCMRHNRGKNTKPEIMLRKALWKKGLRYRLHYKLAGKPDVVFVSSRVAVFVDGCFWHGCTVHKNPPKTNERFWKEKIRRNIDRDKVVNEELRSQGWKIFRVWEHDIGDGLDRVVRSIAKAVRG